MNAENIFELLAALDKKAGLSNNDPWSRPRLYWKRGGDLHPDDEAQFALDQLLRAWGQYQMEKLGVDQKQD